jgi:hypothetical protein
MEGLIASITGVTNLNCNIDLSAVGTQKVYWVLNTVLIDGSISPVRQGWFNRVTQTYAELGTVRFQQGDIDNIQRSDIDGNWIDMAESDLVSLSPNDTVYATGVCEDEQLTGVRQNFGTGELSDNCAVAVTLSAENPGIYWYRVWVYTQSGNQELTSSAGVAVALSKTAQTFYFDLSSANDKSAVTGYAVQIMGNEHAVYFHAMGLVKMPVAAAQNTYNEVFTTAPRKDN